MLSETGCLPGFLFYSFRCGNWESGIGHWALGTDLGTRGRERLVASSNFCPQVPLPPLIPCLFSSPQSLEHPML